MRAGFGFKPKCNRYEALVPVYRCQGFLSVKIYPFPGFMFLMFVLFLPNKQGKNVPTHKR
jgi:hypothetical protein